MPHMGPNVVHTKGAAFASMYFDGSLLVFIMTHLTILTSKNKSKQSIKGSQDARPYHQQNATITVFSKCIYFKKP